MLTVLMKINVKFPVQIKKLTVTLNADFDPLLTIKQTVTFCLNPLPSTVRYTINVWPPTEIIDPNDNVLQ